MAGRSRVEIFSMNNKYNGYPGVKDKAPLQVGIETTSESAATTAGNRITVGSVGNGSKLFARIVNSEACWCAIGADPTASSTALAYELAPNVPLEVEVDVGDKFSFRDVA